VFLQLLDHSSLTYSGPTTYTFPSGYDSLTFNYTFTDTNTNQFTANDGLMSNNYISPLTVSIGDTFTQGFTESLSGINNWECAFQPLNETTTSRNGNIFIYNVLTTNPYGYSS